MSELTNSSTVLLLLNKLLMIKNEERHNQRPAPKNLSDSYSHYRLDRVVDGANTK
jgi:hypothetical protein